VIAIDSATYKRAFLTGSAVSLEAPFASTVVCKAVFRMHLRPYDVLGIFQLGLPKSITYRQGLLTDIKSDKVLYTIT